MFQGRMAARRMAAGRTCLAVQLPSGVNYRRCRQNWRRGHTALSRRLEVDGLQITAGPRCSNLVNLISRLSLKLPLKRSRS